MEIAINTVLEMTMEEFKKLETLNKMVNAEYGTDDSIEDMVNNVINQFLFDHIEANLNLLLDNKI
ncbi:MAG: hypothetical protein K2N81_09960 [Acetatifactor sp.]|nr:hypothetical protein [Acetatifactor sp.]